MLISEFRTKVKSYHGTNNNVATMRLADVCILICQKLFMSFAMKTKEFLCSTCIKQKR